MKENEMETIIEIKEETIPLTLALVKADLVKANGEARAIIENGHCFIDGHVITDVNLCLSKGKRFRITVGTKNIRVKRIVIQ